MTRSHIDLVTTLLVLASGLLRARAAGLVTAAFGLVLVVLRFGLLAA